MSLAIKVKGSDGAWFLLADGIQARTGVVDSWLEMARDIYPGSEVRVVEEAPLPAPETPTHH
ncbi:MAG: hypothetical protein KA538_10850 [Azonexus sp.]|jgi:hypothetical protein|nr:hypothetical protein [Azonexus sp.]